MHFDTFTALILLVALLPLAALIGWLWRAARARRSAVRARAETIDTLIGWAPQVSRIMTPQERAAYTLVKMALPRHLILAQVPLARFIRVSERNSYAEWMRRVGQQCADLVICDRHSEVIAVVEVRPAEARNERSAKRQRRIARVLDAANIPLHVWTEDRLPTVENARAALQPRTQPTRGPVVAPIVPLRTPAYEVQFDYAYHAADDDSFPMDLGVAPPPAGAIDPLAEPQEQRDPPASTWLDDFDSSPVPLTPGRPLRPPDSER